MFRLFHHLKVLAVTAQYRGVLRFNLDGSFTKNTVSNCTGPKRWSTRQAFIGEKTRDFLATLIQYLYFAFYKDVAVIALVAHLEDILTLGELDTMQTRCQKTSCTVRHKLIYFSLGHHFSIRFLQFLPGLPQSVSNALKLYHFLALSTLLSDQLEKCRALQREYPRLFRQDPARHVMQNVMGDRRGAKLSSKAFRRVS
jgi:hypothetical protein